MGTEAGLMSNAILFLALIGGPFLIAELRAHFIREQLAQGQRVRCMRSETDLDMWEKDQ